MTKPKLEVKPWDSKRSALILGNPFGVSETLFECLIERDWEGFRDVSVGFVRSFPTYAKAKLKQIRGK